MQCGSVAAALLPVAIAWFQSSASPAQLCATAGVCSSRLLGDPHWDVVSQQSVALDPKKWRPCVRRGAQRSVGMRCLWGHEWPRGARAVAARHRIAVIAVSMMWMALVLRAAPGLQAPSLAAWQGGQPGCLLCVQGLPLFLLPVKCGD